MRDVAPQLTPVLQGVAEMEASVDTRPKHFFEQVVRIFKNVRVRAVRKHQAIDDDVHLRSAEVSLNQV